MTLNQLIDEYGWNAINSLSKYPSILTYHTIAGKGVLSEHLSEDRCFESAVVVTEKIDGTNSRIICFNDDYIIGSREELLYAKGDRIGNPALNIVTILKPLAEKISSKLAKDQWYVLYGETYGGVVTAASKQYTNDKTYGFRLFDVSSMAMDLVMGILSKDLRQISSWRDQGGQAFIGIDEFNGFAQSFGINQVPCLMTLAGDILPTTLKETFEWLAQFQKTQAGINHTGSAEGVIVRDHTRRMIRKIRFEDYLRTQKHGGF